LVYAMVTIGEKQEKVYKCNLERLKPMQSKMEKVVENSITSKLAQELAHNQSLIFLIIMLNGRIILILPVIQEQEHALLMHLVIIPALLTVNHNVLLPQNMLVVVHINVLKINPEVIVVCQIVQLLVLNQLNMVVIQEHVN